jgi:hypothetical protein
MPCGDRQYARSASGRNALNLGPIAPGPAAPAGTAPVGTAPDGPRAGAPSLGTRNLLDVSLGLLGLPFTGCAPQVLPMLRDGYSATR